MKKARIVTFLLAASMCGGLLSGCGAPKEGTPASGGGVDTTKPVNLIYYMFGSAGVANADIVKEMNTKLNADLNVTLEIKYIDWNDTATKYPLLFASGEQFDMSHASPSTAIPYDTLAKQDALVDITSMVETVTPALRKELSDYAWNSTKMDGKIYAVPNKYSEFTPAGFITRRDLMEKYNIKEVNSIETMEAYLDAAVKDGGHIPLNGSSNLAKDMYNLLVDTTGTWVAEAPGIPFSEMFLVAESAEKYQEVFHPAFKDEFEAFAVKMKEWADKGYWPKDILSAKQDDKDNFLADLSASCITHMSDWSGNYGNIQTKLPGVETDFWCFAEAGGKIRKTAPNGALTVISVNSKNPERALMTIEKFMTDESYYRLMQYGIEGRQYEVADGVSVKPASFVEEKDGGGFSAWAMRNDRFNIPYKTEDPRRYELIEKWNKTAINKPYVGFSFNSTPVSTEIASVANVNATYGIPIMLGKSKLEPVAAVAEYRVQLEQAGINKIIEESKTQLKDFKQISE